MSRKIFTLWILLSLLAGALAPLAPVAAMQPAAVMTDSVTLVGNLQSEVGCSDDWQPECTNSYLTLDANDDVWQGSWVIPAGNWEYKAAIDNAWTENYGAHAAPGGSNIPLELTEATTVTFFYDDKSHWVTENENSIIATVAGSFQSELGCANDWDPGCLRSWLQDIDGDGVYSFQTNAIPVGNYECKVTIDQSWTENYGQNGAPGGDNIPFAVAEAGVPVMFSYNATTHILSIQVGSGPAIDGKIWTDALEHNSRDDFYRQPYGAVPMGTAITLRFRTYANDVTGVRARIWDTTAGAQAVRAMTKIATVPDEPFDYDIWELNLTAPSYLTILYYRFIVNDGSAIAFYEDDALQDGGLGQPYAASKDYSWQIDVYDPAADSPDWAKDAVIYQIFPDRFRNGVETNDPISGTFFYEESPTVNAPQWNFIVPDPRLSGPWEGSYSKLFYGGDLQGIIDKLDYLQEMGINTLYLNPIFEAPSNHKYDATSYEVIDDNFGDLATFITLTTELEERDMRLILDGVFNHTASDSIYFDRYGHYATIGACEAVTSPYRSWYYFRPATPAGTGECAGDTTYEAWWGYKSLPKLNTTNVEAVRTYIYSGTNAIARYWLEQGADGWRLDVAGDVDSSFWRDWRDDIRDAKADAITIAEEWGDASRFLLGDQLDSSMNYRFRNAIIGALRETDWTDTNSTIKALSVSQFDNAMHSIEEDYPPESFYAMMNLVGSHVVNRVLIPLDQDGNPADDDYSDGKMRQKMLAIIQMTMPGAPTVYYGDEIALAGHGEPTPSNAGGVYYADPYNRQPYPWADAVGYNDLPAWRQGDLTMRAHYSATAAIRNAHPALRTGSFDTLLVADADSLYAYGRRAGADIVIIGANLDDVTHTITVDVAGYLPAGLHLTDELNGGTAYTVTDNQLVATEVPPFWGVILSVDEGQDVTAPAAPINLTATEGVGEVELTWTAATGAASYNVYRSYISGAGYELLGNVATLAYTDTDATNGTLYYYVVTALDAGGNESDVSNEVSALPHYTIDWANLQWPHEFTHTISITPTQAIYGQVRIDGVTADPGATEGLLAQVGFGVGADFATWTNWANAEFNGDAGDNDEFMAHLLPEATGNFNYIYRYSTTNGRDWVYAGIDGTATIPHFGVMHVIASADTTAPAIPLNLEVIHWGVDHITTQWDAVGDADLAGYDVYRYAEGETSADAAFVARVMAPATIFTDTSVIADTTYTYTVRSLDTSLNKSGFSNEASGTAEARMVEVRFRATVPPFTPDGATVYIAGDNSEAFGVSWNPGAQPITQLDATTWAYTATVKEDTTLQYKYTRGTWDMVENWGSLVGEANRHLTVSYGDNGIMLVEDVVYNWRDPLVIETYPLAGATTWDTGEPVHALVNRPLNAGRITSQTFTVASQGVPVAGALEIVTTHFDATPTSPSAPVLTGTLIIFTPTVPMTTSLGYTVNMISTGYHDEVDMQNNFTWSFGVAVGQFRVYLPVVMRQLP